MKEQAQDNREFMAAMMSRSNQTSEKCSTKPFLVPKEGFGFYCWSHGANKTHSSKDCQRKKEGHQDDATMYDRKKGKTWNMKRGQKS